MTMLSQVTISVENRGERREVWFLFSSDHENLADLHAALIEDGSVFGQRIETEAAGQGMRRETRRYDFIINRDAIVTICTPRFELKKAALLGGAVRPLL